MKTRNKYLKKRNISALPFAQLLCATNLPFFTSTDPPIGDLAHSEIDRDKRQIELPRRADHSGNINISRA